MSRFTATDGNSAKTVLYNNSTTSTLGAASYQTAATAGSYSDSYPPATAADWSMLIVGIHGSGTDTVTYLHPDQLGSVSISTVLQSKTSPSTTIRMEIFPPSPNQQTPTHGEGWCIHMMG